MPIMDWTAKLKSVGIIRYVRYQPTNARGEARCIEVINHPTATLTRKQAGPDGINTQTKGRDPPKTGLHD